MNLKGYREERAIEKWWERARPAALLPQGAADREERKKRHMKFWKPYLWGQRVVPAGNRITQGEADMMTALSSSEDAMEEVAARREESSAADGEVQRTMATAGSGGQWARSCHNLSNRPTLWGYFYKGRRTNLTRENDSVKAQKNAVFFFAKKLQLPSCLPSIHPSFPREQDGEQATSDVLRARRMLLERGSGGNNNAEIRQGLELFLDELTKQRELEGNQHQPLDICAFCVQFLPSAYQEDKLIDDFRSQVLLGSARRANHGAHHPSRNHHHQQHQQPISQPSSKRVCGSSLVIQHQFVKSTPPSQALSQRPRSSIGSLSSSPSSSPSSSSTIASANRPHYSSSHPAAKPSYRLLTNDITRVLRIESPHGGQFSSSIGAEGDKLMASEVMQNLQSQEKQQTAATLHSMRAKQDAKLRQRLLSIELQAALSVASRPENIVHTIRATGAANSLYTGVVASSSHSTNLGSSGTRQQQHAPKAAIASQSQIKTQKSGRHFKTELFFPPV